jgi:hypothetical protein
MAYFGCITMRETIYQVVRIKKTVCYDFCSIYINLIDYRKTAGLMSISIVSSEELSWELVIDVLSSPQGLQSIRMYHTCNESIHVATHKFTICWQINLTRFQWTLAEVPPFLCGASVIIPHWHSCSWEEDSFCILNMKTSIHIFVIRGTSVVVA